MNKWGYTVAARFGDSTDEKLTGLRKWLYTAKFGYPVIHSAIGVFRVAEPQSAMEEVFRADIGEDNCAGSLCLPG